ncbi:glycosyl transferase family 25 [Neisseria sp. HSC-16F19]|nr:glycosyltransferase family 25 protein [Neisseria sp. HSC-16F19]MCP2039943.1 glycosyl transferase family 25 [Neisseria sp. HSC-16F19]
MKIRFYLINLDGSDERLTQASEALAAEQVAFERVSAYDGRGIDPTSIADYNEAAALAYMGRTLKGGELGCYFSHLDCARRFLASDADFGVVLEDDMLPAPDLMAKTSGFLTWLTENPSAGWYLINIGALKRKIFTPLHRIDGHELARAHYFPMTTTGIIWSRAGAEAFVAQALPVYAPVDNFFRHWLTGNDKGLSVYPPLVAASGMESDIDGAVVKRKTQGRSMWYRVLKQRRLWADKFKAWQHKVMPPNYSRITQNETRQQKSRERSEVPRDRQYK